MNENDGKSLEVRGIQGKNGLVYLYVTLGGFNRDGNLPNDVLVGAVGKEVKTVELDESCHRKEATLVLLEPVCSKCEECVKEE